MLDENTRRIQFEERPASAQTPLVTLVYSRLARLASFSALFIPAEQSHVPLFLASFPVIPSSVLFTSGISELEIV